MNKGGFVRVCMFVSVCKKESAEDSACACIRVDVCVCERTREREKEKMRCRLSRAER